MPKKTYSNFLEIAGVRTATEAEAALDAFPIRQRPRSPCPAQPWDCFAYAVAKTYRATLLFKGEDFEKPTDILSHPLIPPAYRVR